MYNNSKWTSFGYLKTRYRLSQTNSESKYWHKCRTGSLLSLYLYSGTEFALDARSQIRNISSNRGHWFRKYPLTQVKEQWRQKKGLDEGNNIIHRYLTISSVWHLWTDFIIFIRYLTCQVANLLCSIVLRTGPRPMKKGKMKLKKVFHLFIFSKKYKN